MIATSALLLAGNDRAAAGSPEPHWVTLLEAPRAPVCEPNVGANSEDTTAVMENGSLRITDTSATRMLMYRARWNADPNGTTELEARVKLIRSADGPCGQCLDFADGIHEDSVSFYSDRIALWFAKLDYPMNTTDDFHAYRVCIRGTDVQVFVDGKLAIDGKGKFVHPAEDGRNAVQFGAGSPRDTGEALWQSMRFQMRKAKPSKIEAPQIPGLDVQVGETVLIQRGQWYPSAFRFADGRIVVSPGSFLPATGRWSTDGGRTWQDGPPGPANAAIELDGGEVVSLGFWTRKRPDGKYSLNQRRSTDGWKTFAEEQSVLDIPLSVPCGGDGGPDEVNQGFLMDHGVIRLKSGKLMAAMYGNYKGDTAKSEGYGEPGFIKYRTIVVFSSDKGKTWGNPIAAGYDAKIGQEGLCEAGLARASNGDILCVMRSGGRPGIPPTPLYVCRSSDEGQTWSKPAPAADKGVWPNLCVLDNGIVVCTYGRPGNELVFSDDNGQTWKGAFAYGQGTWGTTSSYNSVVPVGPDTVLVVYDRTAPAENGIDVRDIVGTFFTVRRK
ncbi:MAG: exo-alpha-sialidase [Pirellulales bacterium]|nr:exo-alpha-sialidase [Pirellulales bacterium]